MKRKKLHSIYFALDGHSTARVEPILAQSVRLKSANDGNRGTNADVLESSGSSGEKGEVSNRMNDDDVNLYYFKNKRRVAKLRRTPAATHPK